MSYTFANLHSAFPKPGTCLWTCSCTFYLRCSCSPYWSTLSWVWPGQEGGRWPHSSGHSSSVTRMLGWVRGYPLCKCFFKSINFKIYLKNSHILKFINSWFVLRFDCNWKAQYYIAFHKNDQIPKTKSRSLPQETLVKIRNLFKKM